MRGLLMVIAVTLFLTACAATPPPTSTPPPPAPPVPTVAPTLAPAPTVNTAATVEAAVKATIAAAPTSTREPAPTVAPTAAPTKPVATAKETLTPERVIAAFKLAGLEAETPRSMDRTDYGMAPYSRDVTATRFLIPSLGADSGGRLFIGPDADLTRLATYYTEMGKASAALYSHVFRHGNALVQINGDLKDDQAAKYEAALKGL